MDYNNDIAIIELHEPLEITNKIRPLCLPAAESWINPAKPGTVCVAAGWGATSQKKGEFPNLLQEVDIKLISRQVCQSIPGYSNQVTNKMFCAGHLKGNKQIKNVMFITICLKERDAVVFQVSFIANYRSYLFKFGLLIGWK